MIDGAYVALGDSMSIDDYAGGLGRGAASLLFSNDDTTFPEWRGRDLKSRGLAAELVTLARDGATSSEVSSGQLALLRSFGARPAAVTVSVGGNDLLAVFGDTAAALKAIDQVSANTESLLRELRKLYGPRLSIAVTTVYDPSDGLGQAASNLGLPSWPEATALLGALNTRLRSVAVAHGAGVAEAHARFMGHGLSVGDPTQGEPQPANRSLWYCGAVEPNAWGASELRGAFWEALSPLGGPVRAT